MKFDLDKIIAGLSNTTGEVFYNTIALNLNACIGAEYTIIARLGEDKQTATTLTMVDHGQLGDNFTYSLQGTPCADVSDDSMCCYPRDVQSYYPDDAIFKTLNIEGYIGTPLRDSDGDVSGILLALFESETGFPDDILALFELFSGRISAEIERTEAARELERLNSSLEEQVSVRTAELHNAMQTLNDTMQALAEQQKMASLGQLVAGISHEVNTPLGVAILANSVISQRIETTVEQLSGGNLSKIALQEACADIVRSSTAVQHNLARAAELISQFKQVAEEHNADAAAEVDLSRLLQTLLQSLRSRADEQGVVLSLDCPEHCLVTTWAGDIQQIASNIIVNALQHGFVSNELVSNELVSNELVTDDFRAEIQVSLQRDDDLIRLDIRDNGVGIDAAIIKNIFDPFFTTCRSSGAGLGLHIVYNRVKEKLGGELNVSSESGRGCCFSICFSAAEAPVILADSA